MSEVVTDGPVEDVQSGTSEEVADIAVTLPVEPGEAVAGEPAEEVQSGEAADTGERTRPGGPAVTFRGNNYDLVSLGSLITGALILFSCLTCNMGYYCLPFLPVVLGIVGLLKAQEAVEAERTKQWSWLGIAGGGMVLFLILAAIALYVVFYIVFLALMMASGRLD
jgi:hypothetical protein